MRVSVKDACIGQRPKRYLINYYWLKSISLGEILMTNRRQSDNIKHLPTCPVCQCPPFSYIVWAAPGNDCFCFWLCEADIKTSIHSKITAFVKSYKWNVETAYARVSHSQTDGQDWGFLHCLHKPEKQQQRQHTSLYPNREEGKSILT